VKRQVQGNILLWISAVCVSIQNKVLYDHMATLFWYQYFTTAKYQNLNTWSSE